MPPWTNPINYSVGQATCVARLDEQVLSNLDFAGSHTHSGSIGDGSQYFIGGSTISGQNSNQVVMRYITIPGFLHASPFVSNLLTGNPNTPISGMNRDFSSPSNAEAGNLASAIYTVDLDVGTWSFQFVGQNGGTIGACIDSASLGQGTAGSPAVTASTFTVSASGTKQLKLGGTGTVVLLEFRRLSA